MAHIEARVMCHKHGVRPVSRELEEGGQYARNIRGADHHGRADSCEGSDIGRNGNAGVHERCELPNGFAAAHFHGAEFRNGVRPRCASRCFKIDDDERDPLKRRAEILECHLGG